MTSAIELWDKLRQINSQWIPSERVFSFVLTPNERETVLNALRHAPNDGIPKGWRLLPDSANISMHNAAAFAELYVPPRIEQSEDGYLRIVGRCPDWSRVYRVMVDAAPDSPAISPATRRSPSDGR